jgi:uncharacterized protein (DUF952 family)
MAIAYKILTSDQFADLQAGRFAGAPVDVADGYIHLSTAEQLTETANRHFAGQTGLVVAAIDLDAAGAKIRWEVSRGGARFPHLYGRLGMALVVAHAPLTRGKNGAVLLPIRVIS